TGGQTSTDLFVPGIGQLHFVAAPTSGISYRKPGSRWTFANKMLTPFMGAGSTDSKDPMWWNAEYYWLQNMRYINPGFAYRINDQLSVGMTASAGMTLFGIKKHVRSPSHMTALTKVLGRATKDFQIPIWSQENVGGPFFGGGISPYEEVMRLDMRLNDYFSPAYNLGILWEPYNWLSFGGVYQSPFKNQLYGDYKFTYSDAFRSMVDWYGSTPLLVTQAGILNLPTVSVPYQSGRAHMLDFEFPQRVQLGIMVRPVPRIKLLCDLHWANWSVWKEQHIVFDQDIHALQIAKMSGHTHGNRAVSNETGLEDTFHWSFGTEIALKKSLCLRLGYEFRKSSFPDKTMFGASSLPDLKKYGVGLGLSLPKGVKIDIAYGYATGDIFIPNDTSENLNSLEFTKSSTSPFAGLDVYTKYQMHFATFSVTKPLPTEIDKAQRKKDKFKKLKKNIKASLKKLNPLK
ncbi:MAG: outer membrane protein transport protein, partial [Desulfobacterales bacterium]